MKILLIEDDAKTAAFIKAGLTEHGHVVDCAPGGEEGVWLAAGSIYDVMIIDRMLPDLEGLEVLRRIRAGGAAAPILILTALGGIDDRVEGLNAGGDDYLVKPFAFTELYARVCSLARRPPLKEAATVLRAADLEMDLVRRRVVRRGKRIDLQPTEFRLLEFLLRRAGQVVTRTMLLEGVWDFNFDPKTSVVETHISRLRSKLDAGAEKPLIKTVRGAGYLIDETSNS